MSFIIMDGNQAAAWGAYRAGCRFFAGYPLTPATGVYNTMLQLLPPVGGTVLQAEDEIAAMGYCLGASMGGVKTLTATSGPGLSLYSEQLSFAIGSEIPLVIVNVQRLGPSTGAATRGADGDIQFMRWGNSGGLPVIVLSPEDAAECYSLTMKAFDLSETYRVPVFVASNKEIGMTEETVDPDSFEDCPVASRRGPVSGQAFVPFACPDGGLVPNFLPMGGETIVRQTSSAHGPDGYLNTFPGVIGPMNQRMKDKIEGAVDKFSLAKWEPAQGAQTMVVTYGVTTRAAREACRMAGEPVSLLALKTLWPVPVDLIKDKARGIKKVVMVEMNLGQYALEVQRVLPDREIEMVARMDGQLITPQSILEAVHA